MSMSTDLTPLVEVLEAVKPYLSDIVLVGGWAPIVYEQCTSMLPTRMVRTADFDFACLPPLSVKEETTDNLLTRVGFDVNCSAMSRFPSAGTLTSVTSKSSS